MLTPDQLRVAISNAVNNAVYDVLGQMGVLVAPTPATVPASPIVAPAAVPAPAPAAPVVSVPTAAATGVTYSLIEGYRVDDIVPPGTPGTVTLPKTGHTLSLALANATNPKDGEMFMGYVQRVARQAGVSLEDWHLAMGNLGSLILGVGPLFEKAGGYYPDGRNWPEAADRWFNAVMYMTDAERAEEQRRVDAFNKQNEKIRKREQGGRDAKPVDTPA